jgi:metal-responsive CopG/Arc/MetJ family transcriptional regulator
MNINLSMPPQFVAKLKDEARHSGLGTSEIVRRAVDEYLDRQADKRKEKRST